MPEKYKKDKNASYPPNRMLSTTTVAHMLGVAAGSVANWIDAGQLKAGRTPGGHRRVTVKSLLEFLSQQQLPVPTELQSANSSILIVDDEPAVSNWLAKELKHEFPNYKIVQAQDGFEAGEIIALSIPTAIVLDLKMPGLDGFEVCRRLKARQSTSHINVIAMTAYFSPDAEQEILACGAKVLLRKPFEISALVTELRKALE
jgi:excisionase family DNA binding protein